MRFFARDYRFQAKNRSTKIAVFSFRVRERECCNKPHMVLSRSRRMYACDSPRSSLDAATHIRRTAQAAHVPPRPPASLRPMIHTQNSAHIIVSRSSPRPTAPSPPVASPLPAWLAPCLSLTRPIVSRTRTARRPTRRAHPLSTSASLPPCHRPPSHGPLPCSRPAVMNPSHDCARCTHRRRLPVPLRP